MATFLTLSAPEPRDSAPLLAHLLDDRGGRSLAGAMHGEALVQGSRLVPGGTGVVELDVDPAVLVAHSASRYDLNPAPGELSDALRIDLPAPRVVFVQPGSFWVQQVREVVRAGHDAGLPEDVTAAEVSDFLAVLVHSGRGFVARVADGAGVVRVLAATVAALRGDDVGAAWAAPDPTALRSVPEPAARALREVLLRIEVPDAEQTQVELVALGFVGS